MRRAWMAGLVGLIPASVVVPIAQAQIAPIVIRPAKDNPNCQLYLKADGSRLLYRGEPVSPGGQCPPAFVRATVTRFGANSYRMQGRDLDCVINPQGQGRCTREPPRVPEPTPAPAPATAPAAPPAPDVPAPDVPAPDASAPETPAAPATPGASDPAAPAQPGGLPNPG